MRKSLLALVAGLSLVGFGSAARAAIEDVTYTGTVYYGTDVTGVFGPPNSALDGDPFTIVFVFDPALTTPSGFSYTFSGANANVTYGYYGWSPAIKATITINGHSFTFPGSYLGEMSSCNANPCPVGPGPGIYDGAADTYDALDAGAYGTDLPVQITGSYHQTFGAGDSPFGGIVISDVALGFGECGTSAYQVCAYLLPTSVTAGVPETSTWTLALLGFAGLGVAAFRRRRIVPTPVRA